jgi:hypothetical protein
VLFYLLGRACVGNARRLKVLYDVDDLLDPLRSSISVLDTVSYRKLANDWCGIVPNARAFTLFRENGFSSTSMLS